MSNLTVYLQRYGTRPSSGKFLFATSKISKKKKKTLNIRCYRCDKKKKVCKVCEVKNRVKFSNVCSDIQGVLGECVYIL